MQNCSFPQPYYFQKYRTSFVMLQGILFSPKVPSNKLLTFIHQLKLSVVFSRLRPYTPHLSFAIQQSVLMNEGPLLDCEYVQLHFFSCFMYSIGPYLLAYLVGSVHYLKFFHLESSCV